MSDEETTDEPVYVVGSEWPVAHVEHDVPREKATDSWYRKLHDGRVEVMCRTPGFRLRVSAPEEKVWEYVELFERQTGLSVSSEKRPQRGPRQLPGQLPMIELESEG